jgi:hypothetical protein
LLPNNPAIRRLIRESQQQHTLEQQQQMQNLRAPAIETKAASVTTAELPIVGGHKKRKTKRRRKKRKTKRRKR